MKSPYKTGAKKISVTPPFRYVCKEQIGRGLWTSAPRLTTAPTTGRVRESSNRAAGRLGVARRPCRLRSSSPPNLPASGASGGGITTDLFKAGRAPLRARSAPTIPIAQGSGSRSRCGRVSCRAGRATARHVRHRFRGRSRRCGMPRRARSRLLIGSAAARQSIAPARPHAQRRPPPRLQVFNGTSWALASRGKLHATHA